MSSEPGRGDDHGEDDLLVRALRVLETLAGMRQPASMAAVVERMGTNQAQVYRALRALQRSGYVDHVGRRGYRVGTRALSLGTLLGSRPELRELARPVLVRLAAATSTTVTFHLRNGRHRVIVLAAVPPRRSDARADAPAGAPGVVLGERSALTRGCSGAVILAHLPEPQARAVLDGLTTEEAATLHERLGDVRRDGYALSFADNHAGVNGVAVALLDPEGGEPLGALTLSGEAGRLDEAALVGLARRPARRGRPAGAAPRRDARPAGVRGPRGPRRLPVVTRRRGQARARSGANDQAASHTAPSDSTMAPGTWT